MWVENLFVLGGVSAAKDNPYSSIDKTQHNTMNPHAID